MLACHPRFRMASLSEVWNALSAGDVAEAIGVLEALEEHAKRMEK